MTKKTKTVSDVISKTKVRRWKKDCVITIKANTGAGKSYFIKNSLYDVAKERNKKILFLVHRSSTKSQFFKELERDNKLDVIDICTYQFIENEAIKTGSVGDFKDYAYIVCDEFHYFMSDASFNNRTDVSLQVILRAKATKIFMSATGDNMERLLEGSIFNINIYEKYELKGNYDYIEDIKFFKSYGTLESMMDKWLETGEKALIFIQSVEKAYDLYKKYEAHSIFNCSHSNKHYSKYVNNDLIEQVLQEERFNSQFLITTTALDAGVNLIDEDLRIIVCDVEDIGSLQQCVGRKRIKKDTDSLKLYIKNINNGGIELIKGKLKDRYERAQFIRNYGEEAYIKQYYKQDDSTQMVYDGLDENGNVVKKINWLMYTKALQTYCEFDLMRYSEFDSSIFIKDGYIRRILSVFGKAGTQNRLIEEEVKDESLTAYLEELYTRGQVFLNKEEREPLFEKLRTDGVLFGKTVKPINQAFEDNKIPYRFEQFKTSRTVQGKRKEYKNAWRIVKLENE